MSRLFGDRIRALIQEKGVSQADVAKYIGVTQGAVSGWCKGANPLATQLLGLSVYFDRSMEFLLTGRESSGSEPISRHFDEATDESLERLMLSLPGPDTQEAVDVTRDTIRGLRERAKIFSKYAENLLIDAERMEDHLQEFIGGVNSVTRAAGEAAKTYEQRKATEAKKKPHNQSS